MPNTKTSTLLSQPPHAWRVHSTAAAAAAAAGAPGRNRKTKGGEDAREAGEALT